MRSQQEWAYELLGEVDVPNLPHAHYILPFILGRADTLALIECPILDSIGRLALRTLYACGVHESELLALTPDCLTDNRLAIEGPRARVVFVDEITARELGQLLSPTMFPVTSEILRAWLAQAADWTGVAARFAGAGRGLLPKALRHAYASHCVEAGMDLLVLCYQLGHEFIDTTEMYTRTAVALRGTAYTRSHPLMVGQIPCQGWKAADGVWRSSDLEDDEDEEEEDVRGLRYARLTIEEMLLLLESAGLARSRLLVRLLYATGIRLAELLGLRYLDLEARECRLFVRQGKGHKDRYCLIDPETAQMLSATQANQSLQAHIFPLKRPTVQKIITSLAARTGLQAKYQPLGMKVTTHSFRHTFATHCYVGGIDLFSLRMLLGHSQLHTTLTYVGCPIEHRQHVYEQCHAT